MDKDLNVSIVIPCYEMKEYGVKFLDELIKSIAIQDYTDYEVVVSDHSQNTLIETYCNNCIIPIKYFRCETRHGSSSHNLNNAIEHSIGKYIKPMFQDDMFSKKTSLGEYVKNIEGEDWVVGNCYHINYDFKQWHSPHHAQQITDEKPFALGVNTFGAPSRIMFKKNHLRFDDNLIWLMDCEFYTRYFREFGNPKIINEYLVLCRLWDGTVSNDLSNSDVKRQEFEYVKEKLYE